MHIDTHCHINMMVKKEFDRPLSPDEIQAAQKIVEQAAASDVQIIINVGTNEVESNNCIALAQRYAAIYASVGLHPNDCTATWKAEIKAILTMARNKEVNKIVAIGECGMDFHYPDYHLQRQKDVFKAQIEIALEHDLALIVHTRDAPEETLYVLEEYKGQLTRGVIHCFSEDQTFADYVIEFGFMIGIGGTITYPKNHLLRSVATNTPLANIILETDAPFLPPQIIRGQQNHPSHIATIARFLAELREEKLEVIAAQTTDNAQTLFRLPH
jgi:TatD DNase family protein